MPLILPFMLIGGLLAGGAATRRIVKRKWVNYRISPEIENDFVHWMRSSDIQHRRVQRTVYSVNASPADRFSIKNTWGGILV